MTENNHMMAYNLGVLRLKEGRTDEAVALLREAVRIQPSWKTAQDGLAWTLVTHPEIQDRQAAAGEALAAARRAVARSGNRDPRTLDTLAVAQAAAGRMEEALMTAERALAHAKAAGDKKRAEQIVARLALFRTRRAELEGPRG